MKRHIIILLFLAGLNPCFSQITVTTYFGICNYQNGRFVVDFCNGCDSAVWSTGQVGWSITNVPPGNYSVTFFGNGAQIYTMSLTMWHADWDIHLSGSCCWNINIQASLPGCTSGMSYKPVCAPFYTDPSFDVILWQDLQPIDTLTLADCNLSSASRAISPGHVYDVSIYEPSCQCYTATWDYIPARSLDLTVGLDEPEELSFLDIKQYSSSLAIINYQSVQTSEARLGIYSANGNVMYETGAIRLESSPNSIPVDITSWNPGIYIVTLFGKGVHKTLRFIKQ